MALFKDFYKKNPDFFNKRIVTLCLLLSPFLFRQGIYRLIITYKIGPERIADTQMNATLERYILTHPDVYDRQFDNMDRIIHVSLKVTSDALTFVGEKGLKTDPLSTLQTGETNSEGFASFFNTVCNYLIRRYHFSDDYTCEQFIAERLKGGVNLTNAFQSPYGSDDIGIGSAFNRTRDVAKIVEKSTGQSKYVDPTIFEQFNIVDINVVGATNSTFSTSVHSKKRALGKP